MKLTAFLAFLSIVSGGCPADWTRFQQTCLALFKQSVTWSTAQATCRSHNARLATLEHEAKDMNMKMFLRTVEHYMGQPIWVGGNDLVMESHWVWNDKNLFNFTYTNWLHGEPNNMVNNHFHGENCLAVKATNHIYGWMDNPCEERPLPFVCERDVEPDSLIG